MKNLLIPVLAFILITALGTALHADEEDGGARFGIQMSSDSFAGVLFYSRTFEAGLKATVHLYDDATDALGDLLYGGHLAYLFRAGGDSSTVSVGVEAGSYLGDISYAQYIDVGLRVGFNHRLGEHVLLSGLLYPLFISTRELESAGGFSLVATIPKAAVAVAYLF